MDFTVDRFQRRNSAVLPVCEIKDDEQTPQFYLWETQVSGVVLLNCSKKNLSTYKQYHSRH